MPLQPTHNPSTQFPVLSRPKTEPFGLSFRPVSEGLGRIGPALFRSCDLGAGTSTLRRKAITIDNLRRGPNPRKRGLRPERETLKGLSRSFPDFVHFGPNPLVRIEPVIAGMS